MMQGNDSIVSSRPDDEIVRQINAVKSRVSRVGVQDLRPTYDQFTESTLKKVIIKAERP